MDSQQLFRFCCIAFQGRVFTVARLSDALLCTGHKWVDIVETWQSIAHKFDCVQVTDQPLPVRGYRVKLGLR